jgi:site-specific DNA recombinase
VFRSNRIMCRRNAQEPYLLRGLIKCGLCGLTFSGVRMKPPQKDHYYRYNGRQFARGLYRNLGKKCPAKNPNGEYIERLVWADIEAFLRNPGEILERLRQRLSMPDSDCQQRNELAGLKARLAEKAAERERMLGLFRRGPIDDVTLDHHLDMIDADSAGLQPEIEVAESALLAGDRAAQLRAAEELLGTLRRRLEGTVPPEIKPHYRSPGREDPGGYSREVGRHKAKSRSPIGSVSRMSLPRSFCRERIVFAADRTHQRSWRRSATTYCGGGSS